MKSQHIISALIQKKGEFIGTSVFAYRSPCPKIELCFYFAGRRSSVRGTTRDECRNALRPRRLDWKTLAEFADWLAPLDRDAQDLRLAVGKIIDVRGCGLVDVGCIGESLDSFIGSSIACLDQPRRRRA